MRTANGGGITTPAMAALCEGYPVYSVHQHAMAPMALLDLRAAGGTDYMPAIAKGLQWLDSHPEKSEDMVSPSLG